MAVRIELKRSAVPGKVPTVDQLDLGELAINTYDGAIYFKQDTGVSQSIIQVTTTGGTTISASYSVTSSYAVTASYALNVPDTASFAISSSYALTASYAANVPDTASFAISSSYALTASYALNVPDTASFAVSASYAATASAATDFVVSNNLTASNALITGTITAQTLVVQTVSSSVVYSSGSNIFGNSLSNTQQFTGSVTVTGSLSVNGTAVPTGTGTAGQVAFWTGSNVVTGSNNLFWDNASGKLGVGTNTPNGIYSGNNRTLQILAPTNFTSELLLSRPVGAFGAASVSYFLSGAGVDLFGVYTNSTTLNYAVYTNNTERIRVWSGGNITIGAGNNPSDTGERLQVSGSSRFNGNVLISGSDATSATNALLVQNSAGTATFSVRNDGRIANGSTFYLDRYVAGGTVMVISGGGAHNNSTGISVTSGVGIKAYSDVGVGSSNLLGASIYAAGGGYPSNISLGLLSNRALITATTSGLNMHTSSMLQVDSTTQGFLPPRMTAAQRTAIGTPARGLVVYDTDSATEGLWFYNSGSNPGWQEVLTNSGSQSISGSLTVLQGITGSLFGTASWAVSASHAPSALTASFAISASYAQTASFVNPLNQRVSISGSLQITGSQNIIGSGSDVFSVDGTAGRLFEIDDTLSGSLFSVNTVSGLPIIEAFSDNTVRIGQYGQRAFYVSQSAVGIGKENALNGKLDVSGSTFMTGSLNVSQGITGSLFGTASWAQNAQTASFVANAISASYAATASSADDFLVRNNLTASNALINGTITAQTLVVQTVTSSVVYSSGSNIFGNSLSNTQQFTGSVTVTGSLSVNGTARVSGYTLFGSDNSGTPLATLVDFRGGSDTDFIQVARTSTSSDRYVRMYANGQIDALSTKTDSAPFTFAAAANANTSGNRGLFTLTNTFNPTSGTATYTTFAINQTINQTGGANGVTRGLYVNPTLTNAADFRSIEWSTNAATAPSASWGLYGAGTANNFINGSLGIATTSLTGFSLRVSKTITGAVESIGIQQSGVVSNDVTTVAVGFDNALVLNSGAVTNAYNHFRARRQVYLATSFGTQIGFLANNTLTDATNNYGFYGDIPSATGRWNLYMNGTAQNYINGSLGLGPGKTVPTVQLDISGSVYVTGSLNVNQGITGSLFGTASWAQNAQTASFVLNAVSASFAATASSVNTLFQTVEISGALNVRTSTGTTTANLYGSDTSINFIGSSLLSDDITRWRTGMIASRKFVIQAANGAGSFTTTPAIAIISGSNLVGINTSTPTLANLQVNGNVYANSYTGSLFGTASWAQNAQTASFAANAVSASYAATASSADSFFVRQNLTASNALLTGTLTAQTLVVQTVTSSVIYSSGSNTFGDNLNDVQQFTGSVNITGSLTVNGVLSQYANIPSSAAGSNTLFATVTGSYTAGFYKYAVSKDSNARSGEITAAWVNGSVVYTDTSTTDIGDTSEVVGSVVIVGAQAQLNITTTASGWNLKSYATFI